MDEDLLEEIREMIDNGCGTLEIFEYILKITLMKTHVFI